MRTASQRLLDLVRESNGDCTDYRAGKLMGVSTSAITKWRTGSGHMNADNVAKACELAGIPHRAFYWTTAVAADRETGVAREQAIQVLEDLQRMEKGLEPREGGIVHTLIHWGERAAAILAACVLLGIAPHTGKQALAATLTNDEVRTVCILR